MKKVLNVCMLLALFMLAGVSVSAQSHCTPSPDCKPADCQKMAKTQGTAPATSVTASIAAKEVTSQPAADRAAGTVEVATPAPAAAAAPAATPAPAAKKSCCAKQCPAAAAAAKKAEAEKVKTKSTSSTL